MRSHKILGSEDMLLLSVDPGINHSGCALFEGGHLIRAWLSRYPNIIGASYFERAYRMAEVIYNECEDLNVEGVYAGAVHTLVVEWMQSYTRDKSKGDPNKCILPLIGVVSALAGILSPTKLVQYTPHEWKGSGDGDSFTSVIKGRLSSDEDAHIIPCAPSLAHNVYDAIGIGLKALGRLERHRVISRGVGA